MNNYYFEYQISPVDPNFGDVDSNFRMSIERIFNDSTNRFEYNLTLIISRVPVKEGKGVKNVVTGDNEEQVLLRPLFVDDSNIEKANYLFISHNRTHLKKTEPLYLFSEGDPDVYFQDKRFIGVVAKDGSAFKQPHMFVKYVFQGLSEEDITGTGTFGFSSSDSIEPDALLRFNYYCIFKRRIDVGYKISKNGNSLLVEVPNMPKFGENFEIGIAYSSKPIYKAINVLPEKLFASEIKKKTVVSLGGSDAGKPDYTYFKLVCIDPLFDKVINFVDINSRYQGKPLNSGNLNKNRRLCPFCYGPLSSKAGTVGVHKCDGRDLTVDGNIVTLSKNGQPRNNCVICDKYGHSEKHVDSLVVPEGLYDKNKKNIFITILGVPECGKSVYLSSILGLQSGVNSNLTFLNSFLSGFNKSFQFHMANFFERLSPGEEEQKIQNIYPYRHQTFIPGKTIDDSETVYSLFQMNGNSSTERTDPKIRYLPFILESEMTNIVIKDIAGENAINEKTTDESRTLLTGDAYILFLSKTDTTFKDMIQRLRGISNKNAPVAVVLTKYDALADDDFDPSCACNVDDTNELVNLNSYSGSKLEYNINKASEEIRTYIQDNIKDFPVGELEDACKNVMYFNISALGDKRTTRYSFTGATQGGKDIVYYNRPFRAELPLVWIMYHNGIID